MDSNRIRSFASQDTRLQEYFRNSVQIRDLNLAVIDSGCKLDSIPETGQFVQFHSQPQELIEYLSGDFIGKFLKEFEDDIRGIHPLIGILGPENAVRSALSPSQIENFLKEFNAEQQKVLRQSCITKDFSSFQPSAWDQFLDYILKLLPASKGKTVQEKIVQEFQENVNRFLTQDGMCYQDDSVVLPVAVRRCLNQVSELRKELNKICDKYGVTCEYPLENFLKEREWPIYVPLLTNLGEKLFPVEELEKGLRSKSEPPSGNWIIFLFLALVLIFIFVKCRRK